MNRGSGFVDLQVNGYLGVDFSLAALTAPGIARVCHALARAGTIAFCPTVVTASWETYAVVLPLLAEAIRHPGPGARPLGIHLEGPFISPHPGAVGAHRREWTQQPTPEALERLLALADGTVVLMTVAPELPGCEALIARAVARGIRVSLGHTLATDEEVQRAVAAGATLATHVGNGLPQLIDRHQNPLVAQLASPLTAMVSADGHHLPAAFLRLIATLKGTEHLILTSDVAACAGQPAGRYAIFGTTVEVTAEGVIHNLEAPGLAGSGSLLLACANHAARVLGWDENQLWRVARDNPLARLGLAPGILADGGPVQWRDGAFEVVAGEPYAESSTGDSVDPFLIPRHFRNSA